MFRAKLPLYQRIVGKESALMRDIRRYVPSEGWSTVSHVSFILAPHLRSIVNPGILNEILHSLSDCVVREDRVCRKFWLDSNPPDPELMASNQPRTLADDDELCSCVLPYIPHFYVPLRAVARQLPGDLFLAMRTSRFIFLTKYPEIFELAHCIDENALVVRRIDKKRPEDGFTPHMFHEFQEDRELMGVVALALPSRTGLSEGESMERLPIGLRREVVARGYSLTTLCSMYEGLFEVIREDEDSFSVLIRSLVSDEEITDPECKRQKESDLETSFEGKRHELEQLMIPTEPCSAFELVTADRFVEVAKKIYSGREALTMSRRLCLVRADTIQKEVWKILPEDSKAMEYDEILLKLDSKVRRQLSFEEGGLREFLKKRKEHFVYTEGLSTIKVARGAKPVPGLNEDPAKKKREEYTVKFPPSTPVAESISEKVSSLPIAPETPKRKKKYLQPRPANEETVWDDEEDTENYDAEYDGEEDDPLASAVAGHVPEKGKPGISLNDLAKCISVDTRNGIKEEGYDTFLDFLKAWPEWFVLDSSSDNPLINLRPLDELENEDGEDEYNEREEENGRGVSSVLEKKRR